MDKIETYAKAIHSLPSRLVDEMPPDVLEPEGTFATAERQLRTILEQFAGGQSMQPIFDAIKKLIEDSRRDEEIRMWFADLNHFARRVLQDAGYIMTDAGT